MDIVQYAGYSRSHCGYCSQDGNHSFGLWSYRLSVGTYKALICDGWRRSGKYVYKPNLKRSCCKLYTIRCVGFKADKKQRRALKVDLHVKRTKSEYSDEKYALFKKYQKSIHDDTASESGFKSFLCDTPLIEEGGYGSFHECYYRDEKLIGLAVIDVLPNAISSVYFAYDPDYSKLGLGRVSACREASMQEEYYMGFYIPTCAKMAYKAEYKPAFVKQETWVPLDELKDIESLPDEITRLEESGMQLYPAGEALVYKDFLSKHHNLDQEEAREVWEISSLLGPLISTFVILLY